MATFLSEDNGNPSSMRLVSMLALLGRLVDRARSNAPVARVHAVPEPPLQTDRVLAA